MVSSQRLGIARMCGKGGVRLTREYIEHLKAENLRLIAENELKNQYLRKMRVISNE